MKDYTKKYRKGFFALGMAAGLALASGQSALAWGPERPTYTNDAPADHAVFNSITNNPVLGDERDFVRIVEKKTGDEPKDAYTSDIELEAGKDYEVFIYYHNNASSTFNDKAHDYVGVSRKTRMVTTFPDELKAGQKSQVSGIIRSENAEPKEVWDEAYITAKEDMTLHYISGSAKLQNDWGANGSVMPHAIFDKDDGAFLGVNELNGLVLGCYEYSGFVTYTIRTEGVDTPVTPDTPTPETPKALPNTGPAEVFLATALILVIIAGIVYFSRTHRAVQQATRSARGRSGKSTAAKKTRKK